MRIDGKQLGVAWGFEFCVPSTQSHTKPYFMIKKHDVSYSIETGESASGNAQRVTNLLTGLEEYLVELKTKLEDRKLHLSQLKEEIKVDNPYLKHVKKLEDEISKLREDIGE